MTDAQMRRTRNSSCIYTGRVGARMTIRKRAVPRGITKQAVRLQGGPLAGETVRLDIDSGRFTLPLAPMKGYSAGRYEGSRWEPDHSKPRTPA